MNRSHARWYDICYTLLVVALVTAATVRTMTVTAGQLREPFDLVYETPNLRTVEMVRQGKPIYAPAVYDDVPYVFTMYPPLYHTIVAALPDDPAHPYLMGRLVACVAMAGATASLLFIGGVAELPAALLVIGSLWLFHPFTHLTAFLKSDSLGLLLAVVAVVVTGRGTDRRSAVAAAVLCSLAIWAKQVHFAAPLACLTSLWFRGGTQWLWFVATAAILAIVSAAVAATYGGGGMLWCLIAGTVLPQSWPQFSGVWQAAARQPLFVVLMGLLHLQVFLLPRRDGGSWKTPYPWYFLFADTVMLLTLCKPGSSVNYFLEPLLAGSMCFVLASGQRSSRTFRVLAALLLVAAGWEVMTGNPCDYDLRLLGCPATTSAGRQEWLEPQRRAALERHDAVVAVTKTTPRLLNLCNARYGRDLPGEISLNDPYLYGLLFAAGSLPVEPLIARLDNGYFDAVLLPSDHDERRRRRNPALAALYEAVHRNYRLGTTTAGLDVWVQR